MRVWVDCTAAAHPLVLRPIVERLRERGHEVEITAREYGQTVGILDRLGLEHTVVGAHGDSTLAKAGALASRSAALRRWTRQRGFELAAGHGSVDLAVVATLLRIPSAQMQDYEHAGLQRQLAFRAARRVLAPDAIPVEAMRKAGAAPGKLVRYPGLKEEYYLSGFEPDPTVLEGLLPDSASVLCVVRTAPSYALYLGGSENTLLPRVLARLAEAGNAHTVVLARNPQQAETIESLGLPRVTVPRHAVDGRSLVALGDLLVSAGGTMNREAAVLGTPAFSIFEGRLGAVDEMLVAQGKLRLLDDPGQLEIQKKSPEAWRPGVKRDPAELLRMALPISGGQ